MLAGNISLWGSMKDARYVTISEKCTLPESRKRKHGIGGLTMATKRVCDRCGAEIIPFNSVTYAGMRRIKNDINDNDYELCVSCAHKLRKWFTGEENDNG
jgi:hypothetical protein